jgi:Ca2+/Na+ antiporter
MNWYTIFYLFSIVDNLGTFFGWMVFIFTAIALVSWIVFILYKGYANGIFDEGRTEETEEHKQNLAIQRKWVKFSTVFFVIFWLAYIATPTKKDMLLIIAGGAVGEFVATDSSAQKLPADITRFLHAEIVKATAEIGEDDGEDKKEEKKSVVAPEVERIKKMSKEELERILIKEVGINPSILSDSTTSK